MKASDAGFALAAFVLALAGCGGGELDNGSTASEAERETGQVNTTEESAARAQPRRGMADVQPGLSVEYYGGVSTRSSPAGEYLGSSEALIKRVVDREGEMIVDSVLENGRLVEVVMRRMDEPNVMSIEPAAGGYTGTLTFTPDPWDPSEWTYDVRLTGGRRVEGTGRDDGEARVVETRIMGSDGAPQVEFLERLRPLEPSIFAAKRRALTR